MSFVQRFRDSSLGSYLPVTHDSGQVNEAEEMGDLLNKEQPAEREAPSTQPQRTLLQWQLPDRSSAGVMLCNAGRELIPSFLRAKDKEDKISQTSFLDGARGVASFFVMNQHFWQMWTYGVFYGYSHPDARSFFQLPFIRLYTNGAAMVLLFFAISGYSLSYGPLNARRDVGPDKMLASISSSVFRRPLRLFLPPLTFSLIFATLVYLGVCEGNRATHALYPAAPDPIPPQFETYFDQLWHWYAMLLEIIYPFTWESGSPMFDVHLWTIRVEWISSLALYLVMAATARLKPWPRLIAIGLVVSHAVLVVRWDIFTFVGGLLVAETDNLRRVYQRTAAELADPTRQRPMFRRGSTYFWLFNFLFALYLLSMPLRGSVDTPLWRPLYWMIPPDWRAPGREDIKMIAFWWAIGAFQLIWSCANFPPLRYVFTNPIAHYLGKISYALYIVHGPLLNTVGDGTARALRAVIGTETPLAFWTVATLQYIIFVVVLFCVSDVVWRLIDVKSVAFAKWVQAKCFL